MIVVSACSKSSNFKDEIEDENSIENSSEEIITEEDEDIEDIEENETNIMEYPCKDMKILKVFNDEPATVKKESFHHFGMADEFYFELVNQDYEFLPVFPGVVPIEIPEQYMKEGLSVYISGNVTNCVIGGGTAYTRTRFAPIFFFELTSIKIRNLN